MQDPRLHQGCASFWHHHTTSPINPTALNYSFLIFSPSNPAPSPLIPPAQLFPAASRRAAPGAAPLLPLEMAILLFLFKMESCYWAGLFLCFIDCKVQHCSFEMLRAGSAPAPERIRNVAWVDLVVSGLLPKSSGMARTSLGEICCSHRVRDAPAASLWAWTAPSCTKQTPNSPAHILWSVLGAELNQGSINRFIFFLFSWSFDLYQPLYLHISDSLCRLWGEISHWAEEKVEEKCSWKTGIFTNDRIFITNTFKKRLHLLDHW